jgi:hypothetical protein
MGRPGDHRAVRRRAGTSGSALVLNLGYAAEMGDVFTFVRGEVKDCYGYNGNESVDPAVIHGLDEEIPNHSVLSKARARWGVEVFETLFTRIVAQCKLAGLIEGKKLHKIQENSLAHATKEVSHCRQLRNTG